MPEHLQSATEENDVEVTTHLHTNIVAWCGCMYRMNVQKRREI